MDSYRETVYKAKIHKTHFPRFKPSPNNRAAVVKKGLDDPLESYKKT